MPNDIQKIDPRDILVADADEIHVVAVSAREATVRAEKANEEMESLDRALTYLTGVNRQYKDKAKEVRKKMERLSMELP